MELEEQRRREAILDRKLYIVNYNAHDLEDWRDWAIRALRTTYGYEFQGDNLFIARVNVLRCFVENYKSFVKKNNKKKWNPNPDTDLIEDAIEIITWNFWQMDGLNDKVPFTNIPAKIRDWKSEKRYDPPNILEFRELKGPVSPEIRAQEKIEDSLNDIFNALYSVPKKSQTKLINNIKKELDNYIDTNNSKKEKTKKKKSTKKEENTNSLFDV